MQDQHALQPGSILDRYRIIRVLGEGGFGITYLAEDIQLGLKVVIKEYFPNEFAMRTRESTITAKSKYIGDFNKGKQRFKEEAQILAKFNHPAIVKILGYFETNDTAYFVMEYEEGIDLSQYLKQQDRAMSQGEILSIMMPVLEGLKEVHKYNFLHRDIKPGNILLQVNKSSVLIDFGASKLALGETSKSITSMLTEGYAPLEQYSTDIKQQGAFTDLYAVAAVIYKMITGDVPPSAQTRSYQLLSDDNDPLKLLINMNLSAYDKSFLKAIDRALSIKGKDRPQDVQEFQADIAGDLKVENGETDHISKNNKNGNNSLGIVFGLFLLMVVGYYLFNQDNDAKENEKVTKDVIEHREMSMDDASYSRQEYKPNKKTEAEYLKKEKAERGSSTILIGSKMWQNKDTNKFKQLGWKEAINYCNDLTLGGYNDWQLPDIETLKELYEHKDKIQNLYSYAYWSKTPMQQNHSYAWRIYFNGGYDNADRKDNKYYVRCVRDN